MRTKRFIAVLVILTAFAWAAAAQQLRTAIKMDKVPLEQVLDKIEANSDYVFLYRETEINKGRLVSVSTTSTKISDILDEVFKDTDIVYSFRDRQIVLSVRKQ